MKWNDILKRVYAELGRVDSKEERQLRDLMVPGVGDMEVKFQPGYDAEMVIKAMVIEFRRIDKRMKNDPEYARSFAESILKATEKAASKN